MYRRNRPKRVVGTFPCQSQRWDFGSYLCYRTGEWSLESTFRSSLCLQISPGNPLLATRTRWTSVRALRHQHRSFAETLSAMAALCTISKGWWKGRGSVGTPSFSVQRSLGHPLGSSPCCLSEPRTLHTTDCTPPAPKRSPHLSESLVGNQGTSLCISPWQGQRHSVSLPPWWERSSHQHWWSSSSQWWWPRCHPPKNWGSIHSLAETR